MCLKAAKAARDFIADDLVVYLHFAGVLQTQPNSTHLPQPDALQLCLLVTRAVGACNLVLYVGCLPTLICITGGLCLHNDAVLLMSYV